MKKRDASKRVQVISHNRETGEKRVVAEWRPSFESFVRQLNRYEAAHEQLVIDIIRLLTHRFGTVSDDIKQKIHIDKISYVKLEKILLQIVDVETIDPILVEIEAYEKNEADWLEACERFEIPSFA